jgi:murein DD-endopeptidase MepM/ murein hydrolase activator NlpD
LNKVLFIIAKFTLLPIVLLIYKNIVLIKIKLKGFNLRNANYINFFKRILPGVVVALIFIGTTTQNIFAKDYNTEEYANHTLLSSLIRADETQWSEIIEDSEPAKANNESNSFLAEQGNLQELVYNDPTNQNETNNNDTGGISADATSLVVGPEENEPTVITRTTNIQYTVEAGDVLSTIADKFNVTVNTILWSNNLTWTSMIKPGQKLTIPPGSGINHDVVRGDTIASIAKKYQADAQKIISANGLASASDIQVGDLIFVPEGVKPTQIVSSYKPPKNSEKPQTGNAYSDEYVPPAATSATGTKLLWPVLSHRITQYYSWRHTGLDVGDKVGNPIYAAEDGKVERSGWSNGYGNNVIINHGNGVQTLYGHASKLLVKAGDTVSRGQTIALVGSTGWSTGPHLHLEVRENGVRKNPLNYIK